MCVCCMCVICDMYVGSACDACTYDVYVISLSDVLAYTTCSNIIELPYSQAPP